MVQVCDGCQIHLNGVGVEGEPMEIGHKEREGRLVGRECRDPESAVEGRIMPVACPVCLGCGWGNCRL